MSWSDHREGPVWALLGDLLDGVLVPGTATVKEIGAVRAAVDAWPVDEAEADIALDVQRNDTRFSIVIEKVARQEWQALPTSNAGTTTAIDD